MSTRNTVLMLATVGLVAAFATALDTSAQSGPGQQTWTITPSPTLPSLRTPGTTDRKLVQCPLVRARTEVVSTLPAGWWQTPFEGPLVATRVEVMGSDKVLICEYQAYTTRAPVMMKVPLSTDCVAVDTGFNCR